RLFPWVEFLMLELPLHVLVKEVAGRIRIEELKVVRLRHVGVAVAAPVAELHLERPALFVIADRLDRIGHNRIAVRRGRHVISTSLSGWGRRVYRRGGPR